MTLEVILIALSGGLIAGGMNALAGYGSIITLSILMDLVGLPSLQANATNRVGVLANSLGSVYGFTKNGKLESRKYWQIIAATILGALVGVYVALHISNEDFRVVFNYLVIVLLITLFVNPKRWLIAGGQDQKINGFILWPVFLAIGFYGGFIQMGMGIVFLAAAVLIGKLDLMKSNALKVLVVCLYTAVALGIFVWRGLVDWAPGLVLALGQGVGGYLTAHYASRFPQANVWAYRLLIVILVIILLKGFLLGN